MEAPGEGRKVAGTLLRASNEEYAELDLRRVSAERQTSHLTQRLHLESQAYAQLEHEYANLQREFANVQHTSSSYHEELERIHASHKAEVDDLRAANEALHTDLLEERARNNTLESGMDTLRAELKVAKAHLSNAEAEAATRRIDHLRGLAEQAVDAEVARGRELAIRLEQSLKESRARELEANQRAETAATAQAAEGERRARQLRLQLEQLRDAATARDREVLEAMRNQKLAEKQAQVAAENEERVRFRVSELEPRLEDLRLIMNERDALSVKAEQLSHLVEAQGAELRRLQDGKARAKAAVATLRRQLTTERQAHRSAAANAAYQLRTQAEAAALAADVEKKRKARAAALRSVVPDFSFVADGQHSLGTSGDETGAGMRLGDKDDGGDLLPGSDGAIGSEHSRSPASPRRFATEGVAPSPALRPSPAMRPSKLLPAPKEGVDSDSAFDFGGSSEDEGVAPGSGMLTSLMTPYRAYPATKLLAAAGGLQSSPLPRGVTPTTGAPTSGGAATDESSMALASKLKREARSLSSLLKSGAEGYGDGAEHVPLDTLGRQVV